MKLNLNFNGLGIDVSDQGAEHLLSLVKSPSMVVLTELLERAAFELLKTVRLELSQGKLEDARASEAYVRGLEDVVNVLNEQIVDQMKESKENS